MSLPSLHPAPPVRLLLAATVWALSACGGGGGTAAPEPLVRNESAVATAQSGEVLRYVKARLQERGPQGSFDLAAVDGPAWLTVATTTSGTVERTGTTVQEAGVDEDDLLKTDGSRLYALQALPHDGTKDTAFARLSIYTRDGAGRPVPADERVLRHDAPAWTVTRGMQIDPASLHLAVLAESNSYTNPVIDCAPATPCIAALLPYRPLASRVHVQLLDVGRAAGLPRTEQPTQRLEIDGRVVGTRRIGSMFYVVMTHAPQFAFDLLAPTATVAERQAALDRITIADVLPRIRVDGGEARPLVAETDCWLQRDNKSNQVAVTTVTAIDLASPAWARSSRCFVGGSEALYMSSSNLWLATTRYGVQTLDARLRFAPETRTDIHKFSIAGASVAYRGSGSIDGHLGWDRERSAYRMSEHAGDLRVLSFTGSVGWVSASDATAIAPSPATLTVLRERSSDASLQVVGTLPNSRQPAPIGKPGEQVYAVRFLGERGYVVTFRRTDPLYVLDLSDPADPRALGELLVPGFSDWLYPIDGGLLFGVGKDADASGRVLGVKVALFDVRDGRNPKVLDSRVYGGVGSGTALDYTAHGISLETVGPATRLALPMQLMTDPRSGIPAHTLQRFEVDSTTQRLGAKPAIELGSGWFDLASARTLQLANQVYYLRDGKLSSWDW